MSAAACDGAAAGPVTRCATARAAVECSRCSRELEETQEYVEHAACMLEELREAAASRPLTFSDYAKAAQLLDSNRDNTTLLCATMHTLATALATHPPPNLASPPPDLLTSPLISTLASLLSPALPTHMAAPSHPIKQSTNPPESATAQPDTTAAQGTDPHTAPRGIPSTTPTATTPGAIPPTATTPQATAPPATSVPGMATTKDHGPAYPEGTTPTPATLPATTPPDTTTPTTTTTTATTTITSKATPASPPSSTSSSTMPQAPTPPLPQPTPQQVLLADHIGALISTLVTPLVNLLGPWEGNELPTSVGNEEVILAEWKPLLQHHTLATPRHSSMPPSLFTSLFLHGVPLLKPANASAYHQAAAAAAELQIPTAAAPLLLQPNHTPGAPALLAAGSLACLSPCSEFRGDPQHDGWEDLAEFVPNQSALNLKLVLMLERDAPALAMPHGGLEAMLNLLLYTSSGSVVKLLLRSQAGLATLRRPLEALAADATLWAAAPYLYHVENLDSTLYFAGELAGEAGAEAAATHLARPAVGAMDALLQLDPGKHSGAGPLLESVTAALVNHIATTQAGGAVIVNACNTAAVWLLRAKRWGRGHPGVLEGVLLMLKSTWKVVVGTNNPEQQAQRGMVASRVEAPLVPRCLMQMMADQATLKALASVLQADADAGVSWKAKVTATSLVAGSMFNALPATVLAVKPLQDALLEFSSQAAAAVKAKAAAGQPDLQAVSERKGEPDGDTAEDTGDDRSEVEDGGLESRPNSVGMMALAVVQGQLELATAKASSRPSTDQLKLFTNATLQWLDVHAAARLASPPSADDPWLLTDICVLVLAINGSLHNNWLSPHLLLSHSVIEQLAVLMPCFTTRTNWHLGVAALAASLFVGDKKVGKAQSKSLMERMGKALAEPRVLGALLQQFSHEWSLLGGGWQGSSVKAVAGAGGQGTAAGVLSRVMNDVSMADVIDEGLFVRRALLLLSAPIKYCERQDQPEVLLQLLHATAIWDAVKARGSHNEATAGTWYHFAAVQWVEHAGTERGDVAKQVLQRLDQKRVQKEVQHVLPPLLQRCVKAEPHARAPAGCTRQASSSTSSGKAAPAHSSSPTEVPAAARECSVCHAQPEEMFLCSVCQGVRYCSAECQRAAWKDHRKACKLL